ncbi:hypothetical protein R1flu_024199 [Riccia fluitans]|uniref:Uncharacterized protein n=1 Tax=Riccia fluitans TaxID=41844 RepID=A0ABD1XUD4_9MARC
MTNAGVKDHDVKQSHMRTASYSVYVNKISQNLLVNTILPHRLFSPSPMATSTGKATGLKAVVVCWLREAAAAALVEVTVAERQQRRF